MIKQSKHTFISNRAILVGLFTSFYLLFGSTQSRANNPAMEALALAHHTVLQANPWLATNQNAIELSSQKNGPMGWHFMFVQTHQGIRVHEADIKVNISNANTVLSIFNKLKPIYELLPAIANPLVSKSDCSAYKQVNQEWVAVLVRKAPNALGEMVETVYTANNQILQQRPLDLFNRIDTLVPTKVFNPDPLTTAQKAYGAGGLYKNMNGADVTEINAERKLKNVSLQWSNDTFYAANKYVRIRDLESPNQTVFRSTNYQFDFTRSHTEFREMNCLFHIYTYREYLASIGFPLADMPAIWADPTAYQGQDQSRFSYSTFGEPALFFGTGGVADAEDADVITHEYTHGLADFISPNSSNGDERLAVEEANADFMACQYSKNISDYNWRWVFNWDGHNEFWNGRNANSSNVYPADLSTDYYVSSLIWSSMLNDLSVSLNREIVTRLLLSSMYNYANNMSMQETADLLVQADSVLYGYAHFFELQTNLVHRGFTVTAGIKTMVQNVPGLLVVNSQGFANGSGHVQINIKDGGLLKANLYDSNGKLLNSFEEFVSEINFGSNQLPFGIYFLKVEDTDGNTSTVRLMKFN